MSQVFQFKQLVTEFDGNKRCDQCDGILKGSFWRDIPIISIVGKKIYCIKCTIKKPRLGFSSNEVDDFLGLEHLPEPEIIIPEKPINKKIKKSQMYDPEFLTYRCSKKHHKKCTGGGYRTPKCVCECHKESKN